MGCGPRSLVRVPRAPLTSAATVAWTMRASIAALALVPNGLGDAFADAPPAGRALVAASAWAAWVAALVASWWRAPVSLTTLRLLGPAAVAALAGTTGAAASPAAAGAAALAAAATLVAYSAEAGAAHVRDTGYGDERRHLLRPPAVVLGPMAIAAVALWGALLAGLAGLGRGDVAVGAPLAAVGAALAAVLAPRFHRMSRRWVVRVPAGLVLHDDLVLAGNVLVRTQDVTTVRPAPADTRAADLTCATWGVPVELSTRDAIDLRLTPFAARHLGAAAIHASAVLLAPSRPGALLADAPVARGGSAVPAPSTQSPSGS